LSTKLNSPKMRRIRALQMVQMRVSNMTNQQIADHFRIHESAVKKTLSWAEKAGLLAEAEDKILQELFPHARKAIQAALEDDDHKQEAGKLGFELFKALIPGMGKPSKPLTPTTKPDSGDELAAHIALLRSNDSIDGEVVRNDPAQSLPPAETPGLTQGSDATTGHLGDDDRGAEGGETEVGALGLADDHEGNP
jgi:hypothetical protein